MIPWCSTHDDPWLDIKTKWIWHLILVIEGWLYVLCTIPEEGSWVGTRKVESTLFLNVSTPADGGRLNLKCQVHSESILLLRKNIYNKWIVLAKINLTKIFKKDTIFNIFRSPKLGQFNPSVSGAPIRLDAGDRWGGAQRGRGPRPYQQHRAAPAGRRGR